MFLILFVDEETALSNVTRRSLEQTGEFCTDISVSADEAIEKLMITPYDAVISGHHLPDIDCVALVKFIRSRFGKLPVIVFAGTGSENVFSDALMSGADYFLLKQGDPKDQSVELGQLLRQVILHNDPEGKAGGFSGDFCASPGPETADDQFRWLASFTDQNPDPVIEIDMNKEVLYRNPASITCLQHLHMPENPAAFLPPDTDAIIRLLSAGKIPAVHREVPVGDALFEESLVLSPDGRAIRIYAHDITLRVMMVHALERANRKVSRLTGIARHDIRNKLTSVLGYLELSVQSTTDPVLIGFLSRAEASAAAIRNQLEFTKDFENLGRTAPSWLEVSAIIADIQKHQNLGKISLHDQSAGISIYADSLFSQVLSDLVDNSLRHGEHVTAVGINGLMTASGFTLVYEDDGVGIPLDKKEKIFDRVVEKKSGLGLYLAREILSVTGIKIKENGSPGKGVRFEISVPKNGFRIDQ